MAYFRECPDCGAHLDPGERCDCEEENKAKTERRTTDHEEKKLPYDGRGARSA